MKKHKVPVRFTGQHFTVDKVLIADAISVAGLDKDDLVIDIGAGKGFLTVHLARRCDAVLAIEKDVRLCGMLRRRFAHCPNVRVVNADFREFKIPDVDFKVVSSIPYAITSDILKCLMFAKAGHFLGGSLIMQLEPAQKLLSEKASNPYAVFYHTFFDLELMYEVAPESFVPPPRVKSVLLRIGKKQHLGLSTEMKGKYFGFLRHMLRNPELSARAVLKKLFRKSQIREIAECHHIDLDVAVSFLSADQWSGCFQGMLARVPEKFHPPP